MKWFPIREFLDQGSPCTQLSIYILSIFGSFRQVLGKFLSIGIDVSCLRNFAPTALALADPTGQCLEIS